MNVTDLVKSMLGGSTEPKTCPCQLVKPTNNIIQPDDNIGQPGNIGGPVKTTIKIIKDEEGNISIQTPGICVKLEPAVIIALQSFLSQMKE